jgi:hypothetical protein
MREGAKTLHPEPNITWIDDGLPELEKVVALGLSFNIVMMTAVLTHLDPAQRKQALATIASLIAHNGILAMTLRHGPVPKGRTMFDISANEIRNACAPLGLSVVFEANSETTSYRPEVTWTRLALERCAKKWATGFS